jgi:hypothetical protein
MFPLKNDAEYEAERRAERMQDARKLFGHAIREPAEEAYKNAGSPSLSNLPADMAAYAESAYMSAFERPSRAGDLFLWGVSDTMRLIIPVLNMHRSVQKQTALTIAQHLDTVSSHAVAANFPQSQSSEAIYDYPGKTFALSPNEDAVWISDPSVELRENRGCPAVHFDGHEITSEPVFRRFTQWAGVLSVEAYFAKNEASPTTNEQTLF